MFVISDDIEQLLLNSFIIIIICIILITINNIIQNKKETVIQNKLDFYENKIIELDIATSKLNIPLVEKHIEHQNEIKEDKSQYNSPDKQENTTKYVLKLVCDKSRTSRDIQHDIKKTREHVARILKKLHEDGYVTRNISTRPFTYTITEKGKKKLSID